MKGGCLCLATHTTVSSRLHGRLTFATNEARQVKRWQVKTDRILHGRLKCVTNEASNDHAGSTNTKFFLINEEEPSKMTHFRNIWTCQIKNKLVKGCQVVKRKIMTVQVIKETAKSTKTGKNPGQMGKTQDRKTMNDPPRRKSFLWKQENTWQPVALRLSKQQWHPRQRSKMTPKLVNYFS